MLNFARTWLNLVSGSVQVPIVEFLLLGGVFLWDDLAIAPTLVNELVELWDWIIICLF